jgi:hypothetical protein
MEIIDKQGGEHFEEKVNEYGEVQGEVSCGIHRNFQWQGCLAAVATPFLLFFLLACDKPGESSTHEERWRAQSENVDASKTIPFPGGVKLRVRTDEMTDETLCTVFTPLKWGMYAAVYGPTGVAFVLHEKYFLAGDPPPMLRIDKSPPFHLLKGDRPHLIAVPRSKSREVIEVLFTRRKLLVRWYEYPMQSPHNSQLAIGDFASAYDRAARICAWPALNIVRPPMSREPYIYQGERGRIEATFPSSEGWVVEFNPQDGECSIWAPGGHTIAQYSHGRRGRVVGLGEMIFFDSNGQEVSRLAHSAFTPPPTKEILAAARRAGEYGWVQFEYEWEKVSLFGLKEAVEFAERTCGVKVDR